jgi:hypothetical protein
MEIILIVLIAGLFLLPSIIIDIEWLTYLPWWACFGVGVCGTIWMIALLFRPIEITNDALEVVGGVLGSVAYIVVGLHKFKQREMTRFRR